MVPEFKQRETEVQRHRIAMWLIYIAAISSHIITLAILTARRLNQDPYTTSLTTPAPWTIRISAVITAILTVYAPVLCPSGDPLSDAGIRAAAFFYAIKILDLGLIHAEQPPTRLQLHDTAKTPAAMNTAQDRIAYIWGLLSETRYFSFDIAVRQPGRQQNPISSQGLIAKIKSWSSVENLVPTLLIPLMTWIWPIPELKALLLLLAIQISFEAAHAVLHPRCDQLLFDRPFMAASMSEFWASRWHAFASSTLRNLAYRPVRKRFGKAAGVSATFALSGVWHAYAAVVVSDSSRLPGLVFGIFLLFGIVCLLERVIWGRSQGGWTQRFAVWTIAVVAAGYCFDELQRHSLIDFIKTNK